jgi:hypothetical protein
MRTMLAAMIALGVVASAGAQTPSCDKTATPFAGASAVTAARTLGGNPTPALMLDVPAAVSLGSVAKVILVTPLGRPVAAGDKGGLLGFHITLGGAYRIALGGKAWIDVVQAGKSLPSASHAHGEPCSGIAKTVDFALEPGDYILQLSDTPLPTVPVLLTRLP